MGGAADIGATDEREEFGFPGDAFSEVGVEVDDFHNRSLTNWSNSCCVMGWNWI